MNYLYKGKVRISSAVPSRDNCDNWTVVFCKLSEEERRYHEEEESKYIDVSKKCVVLCHNCHALILYRQNDLRKYLKKRNVPIGTLPYSAKCRLENQLTDLLIHLELGVAILEEGVDLLGGCDTGIDVGLGSLGTHLLRS